MSRPEDSRHETPLEILIVRVLDAPREIVFRNWVEPQHMQSWFAPSGFTTTRCEIDARPGGRWRIEYRSDDSDAAYSEYGEFRELTEPERIVFSLTQEDERGRVHLETLVKVTFAATGAKTEMTFHQTGFDTVKLRNVIAEGWGGCFQKLDLHLKDR